MQIVARLIKLLTYLLNWSITRPSQQNLLRHVGLLSVCYVIQTRDVKFFIYQTKNFPKKTDGQGNAFKKSRHKFNEVMCLSNSRSCWFRYVSFWPDCKPEGPLFSAEFVCLCVSDRHFSVNRFWRNLVTRTLVWSSLATTIMVQIGRRGTARHLFENFKKFSKITEFEFQNSGLFFASVSPVYCKKLWTQFEPNWRRR